MSYIYPRMRPMGKPLQIVNIVEIRIQRTGACGKSNLESIFKKVRPNQPGQLILMWVHGMRYR